MIQPRRKRRNSFRKPTFKSDHDAVSLINTLPKEHKAIVAKIVWWDCFANRLVANRTALFDDWLAEPMPTKDPLPEGLSLSLQKMGYPKEIADARANYKMPYRPKNDKANNHN